VLLTAEFLIQRRVMLLQIMAAGFAIFAMRLHHVMAHLHREEKQCPRCALLISRQDQWRSQPKIGGGAKCLILGEQQYFVWDTASQSTK